MDGATKIILYYCSPHETQPLPHPHYSPPTATELCASYGDSYQTMTLDTTVRTGVDVVVCIPDASTAVCDCYRDCCGMVYRETSVADRVCGEETLEYEEVGFIYLMIMSLRFIDNIDVYLSPLVFDLKRKWSFIIAILIVLCVFFVW